MHHSSFYHQNLILIICLNLDSPYLSKMSRNLVFLIGIIFIATGHTQNLLPGQNCTTALAGGGILNALCTVAASDPTFQLQTQACDAHCVCTHNTPWGQCEPRPSTAPDLPFLDVYENWCRCYLPSDPPRPANLPAIDSTICGVQNAVVSVLCSPVAQISGVCNADCICTHGNSQGICTTGATNYCACL